MERTILLSAYEEGMGESPNLQFETIQGASILLGGGEGAPERETPSTRFCINVEAKALVNGDFTEPVHIQLWITPVQIAEIVKAFFLDFLRHAPRVYKELLERILRKRWAIMTSGVYRMEIPGLSRLDPYHKIRGV